ncbi:hypothetical protein J2X45_003893 [Caulobacter sp. BE264]|uniref:DUF968 domain-containing protein n=1 Tax=Caulobacter sp. BE264 TaxID=2817724 RepID=UPI00285D8E6F|nr:hypothetical protein [Caulobacter sp. BE264]MDR7232783.1 hypothetical protein [Caulobacter sp. BE264]
MAFGTLTKPSKRVQSRSHLEFIRQLPCVQCAIEGRETYGVDAAHVSFAFPGWAHRGKGTKVDDARAVPSCRTHHDEQHADGNERRYWARYRLNPVLFCQALVDCDGDLVRGAQVVRDYADHARRGLPTVHVATGPVTRRAAGPVPVTITAHLATRPADEHGNVAVLIPREAGLKDAPCELVWVAPTAVQPTEPRSA